MELCDDDSGTRRKMNSHTKRMADRKKRILRLFAEGHTQREIGRHVGIHPRGIYQVLKAAGKLDEKSRRTPQQTAAILQLFEEGATRTAIARHVGFHRRTVYHVLKSAGKLPRPTPCGIVPTPKQEKAVIHLCEEENPHYRGNREVDARNTDSTVLGILVATKNHDTLNRENSPEYPELNTGVLLRLSAVKSTAAFPLFKKVLNDPTTGDVAGNADNTIFYSASQQNSACTSGEYAGSTPTEQNLAGVSSSCLAEGCHTDIQESAAGSSSGGIRSAYAGRLYRCDLCGFRTYSDAVFSSHLLGAKHGQLAAKGIILRCSGCPFRTRKPKKMVGHALTYQFHVLPEKTATYSIA